MEYTIAIINALKWPVFILVVLWVLRKYLANLINRIENLSMD